MFKYVLHTGPQCELELYHVSNCAILYLWIKDTFIIIRNKKAPKLEFDKSLKTNGDNSQ